MKQLFVVVLYVFSSIGYAASIPKMSFPLKNGAAGEVYKMEDYPNSVFVFEAYRLTCTYCNKYAPLIDKLADEYRDNDRVHVVDLGLDTYDNEFAEWIRNHKPNHPVVQDVNRTAYRALKLLDGIPQTFVIDCNGNRQGVVGQADWLANTGEKKVRELISNALKVTCE